MSPAPLIFINRYFHPDHSATSQMLGDLAFSLAREGRPVTVITSRLIYDDEKRQLPPTETVDGVRIVRVWTTRFGRSRLLGRAVDYASFYLAAAFSLLRRATRDHTVIAKTDPPMLSVIAGPIARLKGAQSVNWLQDVFPEVAVAIGLAGTAPNSAPMRALKYLRDRSLRMAHLNVALGERMQQHLSGQGVPQSRISIIPNWQDGRLVQPVPHDRNPLRSEWQIENDFIVAYSGNLGRAHDGETFLTAIEQIEKTPTQEAGKRIVWLFIGGGAAFQWLKTEATKRGLTSILFKPYQPREKLALSLSAADVHLISLRPELEGLIVPSKYYGIAAAGRPCIFIGDDDGEIARVIERTGSGLTVAQGDGTALARAVLALASDPRRCTDMGTKARGNFEREYDLPIALDRWKSILDDTRK